ncbi:MAG: hypothetical protein KGZ25_02550 [Planctomycetes bacterium]|nr:hypothetical protein [Planctomycetota bacterium]
MIHVEKDAENGTDIFQLLEDPRPADDLYGEQPYSSPDGNRVLVRHFDTDKAKGGLTVLELTDGESHPVLNHSTPTLAAFHAWGENFYYQEPIQNSLILMKCNFGSQETTEITELPDAGGNYSYGTVSPDENLYVASVHPPDESSLLVLVNLNTGEDRILAESAEQWFKHEQFSRDGRNKILIQANSSDVSVVNLGEVDPDTGEIDWFPVDAPPPAGTGNWPGGQQHTPRCTGHEAWIGRSKRIFLSTGYDETTGTNIWTAAADEKSPEPVGGGDHTFGHVSVSRCGRFWIADAPREDNVPVYAGAFETGKWRRVVFSRTLHDGKQWSHTHPYLTADNRWLVFNSNRSGLPQIHGARLPEGFLEELL